MRALINNISPMTPSRKIYSVTPSDELIELRPLPKALYIGVGGDITLIATDDVEAVLFQNIPDGFILSVRAQYIRATGTTASNIVALA